MRKGARWAGLAGLTLLTGVSCSTKPPLEQAVVTATRPALSPTTTESPLTTTTALAPAPVPPTTVLSAARLAESPTCGAPSVPSGANQLATPVAFDTAYSATAGGPTVGYLQAPWGGTETRPVVAQDRGWVAIRLNTRPNGSTAWLAAERVTLSATPYRVVVSICQRTLTIYRGADPVYSSPVGVGRPQSPTPLGSTFIDAVFITPRVQVSTFGPTVFVLGAHSNVFTDFDGGDGMVSIHGYPSDPASTRGVASSHGCVRASPETINALRGVPVGTPVDIVG